MNFDVTDETARKLLEFVYGLEVGQVKHFPFVLEYRKGGISEQPEENLIVLSGEFEIRREFEDSVKFDLLPSLSGCNIRRIA